MATKFYGSGVHVSVPICHHKVSGPIHFRSLRRVTPGSSADPIDGARALVLAIVAALFCWMVLILLLL